MQRIEWNWYGTWLVDYFCCNCPYDAYDIWESAYLQEHTYLLDARETLTNEDLCDEPGTTLDLLTNHYHQSMQPIWDSWVFIIWQVLHWPLSTIHGFIWTIKRKF